MQIVTWQRLLAENKIRSHAPSANEIANLFALVERDLEDAALVGLSADRSFAISYNAVQQLSQAVVACSGYRLRNIPGHHRVMFECLELAVGSSMNSYSTYFDRCRTKRNHLEYDRSSVVSQTEADELLKAAQEFHDEIKTWISDHHKNLLP